MDWTSDEGDGMPIGPHGHMSSLTEVSLMSFTLHLSSSTRKQLYRRLQQAYARGALRLVRRLHALLALAENMSVHDVAEMVALGAQTVRAYRNQFLAIFTQPPKMSNKPGVGSSHTTTRLERWGRVCQGEVSLCALSGFRGLRLHLSNISTIFLGY
jgi:hypothetical protein